MHNSDVTKSLYSPYNQVRRVQAAVVSFSYALFRSAQKETLHPMKVPHSCIHLCPHLRRSRKKTTPGAILQ